MQRARLCGYNAATVTPWALLSTSLETGRQKGGQCFLWKGGRGRAQTFMHAYQPSLIKGLTSSLPPPPRCFSCAHL